MEGESCYSVQFRCGQFKEGRMVVIEVDSLMEGELFCYKGGLFNGGQMVVREEASLMEGEWSCYRGGQFKGGRMIMLIWSL